MNKNTKQVLLNFLISTGIHCSKYFSNLTDQKGRVERCGCRICSKSWSNYMSSVDFELVFLLMDFINMKDDTYHMRNGMNTGGGAAAAGAGSAAGAGGGGGSGVAAAAELAL